MITTKQKEILDYIISYEETHGYGPSLEETAKHFKKAISTIHQHIKLLTEKGYLKKLENHPRSVGTFRENDYMAEIPLLGFIAAGEPIEPIENAESITVSRNLIKGNSPHYALKVKGDSMINEGILDDDIVVIKSSSTPINGDIVVAITHDGATLKKFYTDNGRVELRPRNPTLKSRYYAFGDIEIRGIFCGLVRQK